MKDKLKYRIARRPLLAGTIAALGLGAAGLFGYEISVRHARRPGPFDDLLAGISDRSAASRLGQAVRRQMKQFNPAATAARLRAYLKQQPLSEALATDLAQDRMIEIDGWILPDTFALLCALATEPPGA